MKITDRQICEDQIVTFTQSHILLYHGLLFSTWSTCVIVDARSHTCKSHDFIPRYDIITVTSYISTKWLCICRSQWSGLSVNLTFIGIVKFTRECPDYVRQTHETYQILPYSMDFKSPGEFWNPLNHTVLDKYSLFGIKDLLTSEMTMKPKSNLYVGPVNIFPIFDTENIWHGFVFPCLCLLYASLRFKNGTCIYVIHTYIDTHICVYNTTS